MVVVISTYCGPVWYGTMLFYLLFYLLFYEVNEYIQMMSDNHVLVLCMELLKQAFMKLDQVTDMTIPCMHGAFLNNNEIK